MRIRIVTSCTGEKRYSPANKLTQSSFTQLHDTLAFTQIEEKLADFRMPAAEMYTGQQHVRLMDGVSRFQEKSAKDEIDLWILSAGYGLIPGKREIVPYECSFQGMRVGEIREWARHLRIPQMARTLFTQPSDLLIILLGDSYLRALELDDSIAFAAPVFFFAGQISQKHIKGQGTARILTLSSLEANRFSCGLVGLKGEVARRFLLQLSVRDKEALAELLNLEQDVIFDSLECIA